MSPVFLRKHVLARVFEGSVQLGSGLIHHITHTLGNQMSVRLRVEFFIEGFTHDLRQLRCDGCWVCCENELGFRKDELTEILELELGFFDVVGNWEVIYPVLCDIATHLRVRLDILSLEFDDFPNAGHCIVLRVVELFLFCFFLVHFPRHSVFHSSL